MTRLLHDVTEDEVEEVLAEMMNKRFPPGWNEERVLRVLSHYENQTDEETVAEDEAAFKGKRRTVIEVPVELMPVIREILAQYRATAPD